MRQDLETRIRKKLASYLARKTSLRAFNRWLVSAAWDIDQSAGRLAPFVGELKLRLDEYSNGHWTEPELREKLALTLNNYQAHGAMTVGAKAESAD